MAIKNKTTKLRASDKAKSSLNTDQSGSPQTNKSNTKSPGRRVTIVAVAAAIALCLAIYFLRLDRAVGMAIDDAWYVMLAKALATGQGYSLINSPSSGILPLYPPFFPLLLSVVFKLAPQFPGNVMLLKSASIVAMLLAGVVCYRYFTRFRGVSPLLAGLISLALMLNPAMVFLSTSTLMSESVFTLLQLLTILIIERAVRENEQRTVWRYLLMGAVLAVLTYLTRSIGLTLMVGALGYLIKERLWRMSIVFALAVMVLAGPWMLYAKIHAPTEAQQAEQNCYIVYSYTKQLWMKQAGNSETGQISLEDLPVRVLDNSLKIAGEGTGKMFLPILYRSPRLSGQEFLRSSSLFAWLPAVSYLLFAIIVVGYIAVLRERITLIELVIPPSLVIIVLWPWEPTRFVLPFLPFLIFYFIRGLQSIYLLNLKLLARAKKSLPPRAFAIIVGCLIALYVCDHAAYLVARFSSLSESRPQWLSGFEANETALKWMSENLGQDGSVIATVNPGLVYLYTGIKTVGMNSPEENWELWKTLNVRYLAYVGRPDPFPPPQLDEARLKILYKSNSLSFLPPEISLALRNNLPADNRLPKEMGSDQQKEGKYNFRVIDLGPPSSRTQWRAISAPLSGIPNLGN